MNLKELTTEQRKRVYEWLERLDEVEPAQIEPALASEPDPLVRAAVIEVFARSRERGAFDPFRDTSLELSDYEILERLGSGGMGIVHRARHRATQKEFAIKFLQAFLRLGPQDHARFRTEAIQSFSLRHPNIVRIHSVGEENGVPFIVMDFVDGVTLSSLIKAAADTRGASGEIRCEFPGDHGPQSHPAQVAKLLLQIADALQYSHEAKIVHFDVKPSNILIDRSGNPLLSDFGVSQDLRRVTEIENLPASPYYMSPEQARSRRVKIDHRADIYSLGVVGYELLTLSRPFDGPTKIAVYNAILRGDPPRIRNLNPAVPRTLAVVIEKSMQVSADLRYQTAREFADDLRAFLEHREPSAKPPTFAKILATRVRRHWPLLSILAGAAVIAVASAQVSEYLRVHAPSRLVVGTSTEPMNVFLARLDQPDLHSRGEFARVGEMPLALELEPGCYRVRFESLEGDRVSEVPLVTVAGATDQVVEPPRLVAVAGNLDGMVEVKDGVVWSNGDPILIETFWIDRFEVTNRQYRAFAVATGRSLPPLWNGKDSEIPPEVVDGCFWDLPVTAVTASEAAAYAEWAGKRLPTLHEWLCAASRSFAPNYVWGDDDSIPWTKANLAAAPIVRKMSRNFESATNRDYRLYLSLARPGGSFASDRSWCGVYDLQGNVREWLSTPAILDETVDPSERSNAGGCFAGPLRFLDEFQAPLPPNNARDYVTGFRCVMSAARAR